MLRKVTIYLEVIKINNNSSFFVSTTSTTMFIMNWKDNNTVLYTFYFSTIFK